MRCTFYAVVLHWSYYYFSFSDFMLTGSGHAVLKSMTKTQPVCSSAEYNPSLYHKGCYLTNRYFVFQLLHLNSHVHTRTHADASRHAVLHLPRLLNVFLPQQLPWCLGSPAALDNNRDVCVSVISSIRMCQHIIGRANVV